MSDALAASSSVALPAPAPLSPFRQFYVLTKPKVVQLIVFCAVIGMLLAVPGMPTQAEALRAVAACAGIWLVAGAAAAFNCLIEQGIDARMKRTAWRPPRAAICPGARPCCSAPCCAAWAWPSSPCGSTC